MQKNFRKKNFTSKPPKTFRQEDDYRSDARGDERKPSGKKFFQSKKRDDDFGGGRSSQGDKRGFSSGRKQYRDNYQDDQPKPLYSTGGKKRQGNFKPQSSNFNQHGDYRSEQKDFNPKFSGKRNNDRREHGNFKSQTSNFKQQDDFRREDTKPFRGKKDFNPKFSNRRNDDRREHGNFKPQTSNFKQQDDFRGEDTKPFREKKDFNPKFSGRRNDDRRETSNFNRPSYRGNDEGKLRAGKNYRDERGGERKSFGKKTAFSSGFSRGDDARPFREKRGFDAKFSGKKPFKKIKGKRTTKTDTAQMLNEPARLNKYLAHAGIASRREADELIKSGFVTVNGQVVLEMGHKVQPGDEVRFKNRIITPEQKVYILLNKPKDYITTVSDERGRPTVMDLIQNATDMRIYPVGRLDRNTTGLLLLTNDGELAQKLTHPSFEAKKVYLASLDKPLKKEDMQLIAEGVMLEEGKAMVDAIEYADPRDKRKIGIELHIGWNKVVRRIFDALDYEVVQLDRVYYAGLTKDVPRGKWRNLTEKEVLMLKHFT